MDELRPSEADIVSKRRTSVVYKEEQLKLKKEDAKKVKKARRKLEEQSKTLKEEYEWANENANVQESTPPRESDRYVTTQSFMSPVTSTCQLTKPEPTVAAAFAKSISNELQLTEKELHKRRLQEYVARRTLEAVNIRMTNSSMCASMMQKQEDAIAEAFGEVNVRLAKLALDWEYGNYLSLAYGHVLCRVEESAAQDAYNAIALRQAMEDAAYVVAVEEGAGLASASGQDSNTAVADCGYAAWKARIASDMQVLVDHSTVPESSPGTSSSASTDEDARRVQWVQWSKNRAKAILEGDQKAILAAWPHGADEQRYQRERLSSMTAADLSNHSHAFSFGGTS